MINSELIRIKNAIEVLVTGILEHDSIEAIKKQILLNYKNHKAPGESDWDDSPPTEVNDVSLGALDFVFSNIEQIIAKLKKEACLTQESIIEELQKKYEAESQIPQDDRGI